jgi:hypothetical protein
MYTLARVEQRRDSSVTESILALQVQDRTDLHRRRSTISGPRPATLYDQIVM